MKKCPYCAEEIQDAAIVCKHCGKDLTTNLHITNQKQSVETSKKKNKKSSPAFVLVIFILCLICGGVAIIQSNSPEYKTKKTQEAIASMQTEASMPTPTRTIDSSIKAIMDGASLSEEEAGFAFEVIKSVGFERVEKLEPFMQDETMKAYTASLGYTKDYLITFVGSSVFGISREDLVLYDKDAGGVIDKITNYTLKSSEEGEYLFSARDAVKSALKAPSTAKFPDFVFERDQWKVVHEKNVVWVQSWVDAENSFGANIRSHFTTQFDYNTQLLVYLELDGEVLYGSVQEP